MPAPDEDLIPGVVGNFIQSEHGFDVNLDGENQPDDGVPYYNHEYGGFTKKLTRETRCPLAPGDYTIKIVVQDVFDRNVDSAIFLENGSLKLFTLVPGDYNLDGVVNGDDYSVWSANFGQTNANFCQRDGNGDCVVTAADYTIWRDHKDQTGNANYRSDFNRDNAVNGIDVGIMWPFFGLGSCASRLEGDTNRDGDVDPTDLQNLQDDTQNPVVEACAPECCPNCGQQAMAGRGGETLSEMRMPPPSADVDGDGDLNETDLAILDWIILGLREIIYASSYSSSTSSSAGGSDSTPAPNQAPPAWPDVDGDGDGDSDQHDLALIESLMQQQGQEQVAASSSADGSPSPDEVDPTQNGNAGGSDELREGFGPRRPFEQFPDPPGLDRERP